MSSTADLSVRQHERHICDLPAGALVAPSSAGAVKLLRVGAGGVPVRVVDHSRGGLGLRSPVFFPQSSMLRLSIACGTQTFALDLRVQRVTMLDRTPSYYVGTAFEESTEKHATLDSVLAFLRSSSSKEGAGA